MAQSKSKKRRPASDSAAPEAPVAAASTPPAWTSSPWLWIGLIFAALLIFYWIPLTSADTSIQWDAVDTHYSPQKYFADHVRSGHLPFWTPYIFSGFPFLSDPQVAAWYPPNWPFFLTGISPRSIEAELALHALLAALGTYFLALRLVGSRPAALLGALAYALSGFFAEHSSHVGMFSTAAGLPWLLLFFDLALETAALRNTILAGLAGGTMILAGHFQAALYAFAALALFGLARIIENRARALRIIMILAAIAAVAVLLSAIQTAPGLQLAGESIRSHTNYSDTHDRVLRPSALLNFFVPDATGVFSYYAEGKGAGAGDALYYLYSGILLIPLAIAGLQKRGIWLILGGLLIVLPLWYMLGPSGGLYRLGAILPGFHRVRGPIHFLFVPLFGLALLASAGYSWITERWKAPWIAVLLPLVFFADVYYWNSFANPLAYATRSFDEFYGSREQLGEQKVALVQPPLTRFEMPDSLTVFGPLNHPLDLRLEAVYGYNPLEIQTYSDYLIAARSNRRLLNGLNVSRYLDVKNGAILQNADALPRVYFAKRVQSVTSLDQSRSMLGTLDPSESALVLGTAPADLTATASITGNDEQSYRIKYQTGSPALLKISVPYFPGWSASIAGRPLDILRVDHALMGVVAPAGQGEIELRFRSTWFTAGALVSALTALAAIALLVIKRR